MVVVWGASRILVVSAIQTQIINSTTNQPLLIKARRYVYQLIKATQKGAFIFISRVVVPATFYPRSNTKTRLDTNLYLKPL